MDSLPERRLSSIAMRRTPRETEQLTRQWIEETRQMRDVLARHFAMYGKVACMQYSADGKLVIEPAPLDPQMEELIATVDRHARERAIQLGLVAADDPA